MYDNQNNTPSAEMPPLPWGFMIDEDGMIAEDPNAGPQPVSTSLPENYQPHKPSGYQTAYSRAMDNFTAEDLDRRCTEVHEANEAYRRLHGIN